MVPPNTFGALWPTPTLRGSGDGPTIAQGETAEEVVLGHQGPFANRKYSTSYPSIHPICLVPSIIG